MGSIHEYQVFIASPGDVQQKREIVRDVCRQLNDDRLFRSYDAAPRHQ